MRRIAFTLALLSLTAAAFAVSSAGADDKHTYQVEFYNAFGIVDGSEVRVAGVVAGTVKELDVNESKRAVITIEVTGPLSSFRTDASCSAEPQSLIAEYFVDCQPGTADEELTEDDVIPAERNTTTVQNDLVQNTLREPFKRRLALIFNEFGTALAGNPKSLNIAIRNGAPALQALRKALDILARQNAIIRDLNVDSDKIIARLTERREDVIRFIEEANETSVASAERREDIARDFELLPGFLAELRPTLVALGDLADAQTPLLVDLGAAAPELNRLAAALPPFNDASVPAIETLGDTAVIGRRALVDSADEIRALRESLKRSFSVADQLANFLVDLDDPQRRVEIDARAPAVTGRRAPTGYSGLEGLLNYVYYQTLAINQFDSIGHLLHFVLAEFEAGPCGEYHAGEDVAAAGGGETSNPAERNRCVAWLGPSQPGVTNVRNFNPPPYHPSVCPDGSNDLSICNPAGPRQAGVDEVAANGGDGGSRGDAPTGQPGSGGGGDGTRGNAPGADGTPQEPLLPQVPGIPNLPGLDGLGGDLDDLLGIGGDGRNSGVGGLLGGNGGRRDQGAATNDLLNFLFSN